MNIQLSGRSRITTRTNNKGKTDANIGAWNVRTLQDNTNNLPENSQLEEHGSGYTFFWSNRLAHDHRQSGVDFAVSNHYLKLFDKLPERINDRLATMRMKGNNSPATFISAYAPTMAYSDQSKEEFYEQLDHAIQSVLHSDKLFLLGDFNARVGSDHTTWY